MFSKASGFTIRAPALARLSRAKILREPRHVCTSVLIRVNGSSSSSKLFLTMGIASGVLLASSYTMGYSKEGGISKTTCDTEHDGVTQPGGGKILHAAELKEGMQEAKLERILHGIDDLAKEVTGGSIRRYVTKKASAIGLASEDDNKISLRSVDLSAVSAQDTEKTIEELQRGKLFDRESLISLMKASTRLLKEDPSLVDLRGKVDKVTVVGDLHGSFECLCKVLELVGDLKSNRRAVIVTGDFVDRGANSLEVFSTLLLLKLAHPENVFLLRGNHEDTMISSVYGFQREVQTKYGREGSQGIWNELADVFASLPIAARTETAAIMHGGLPSAAFKLSDLEAVTSEKRSRLRTLVKPQDDQERLLQGILWSDPTPFDGVEPSERGCGIEFGVDVARDFLDRHGLKYILRSHEHAEKGIQAIDCGDGRFVVTVFSAAGYPNGQGTNVGAVLTVDSEGDCEVRDFRHTGKNIVPGKGLLTTYKEALSSLVGDSGSAKDRIDYTNMRFLRQNREMLLTVFALLVNTDGVGGIDRKKFETGIELFNKRLPKEDQIKNAAEIFEKLDFDGSGEIQMDKINRIFHSI